MPRLPRKHIRIGAGLFLFMGLFFGVTTYLGAEWLLRPQGTEYATAELIGWMVDIFGRTMASVVIVAVGALAAVAFLRFMPASDD